MHHVAAYYHEALQMVNKQDVALQKFPHTFPMVGNLCTYKLQAAATVHFLWAKWFVHACNYKVFSCCNYKAKINANYKLATSTELLFCMTTVSMQMYTGYWIKVAYTFTDGLLQI